MKPENGAVKLLLLVEMVLLVIVVAFGVVKKLQTPESGRERQQEAAEMLWEDTEHAETEYIADEADSKMPEMESALGFSEGITEKLAAMTLEEKVAQMFLTTPESLTQMEQVTIAGEGTRTAISQYPVGGLIYSRINYQGREQAGNLIFNAEQISKEQVGEYLFLAVKTDVGDEEAGVGIADSYEPDAIVETLASGTISENGLLMIPTVYPAQQSEIASDTAWVMLDAATDVEATGEENLPCALSKQCVENLRTAGYEGIILTDSLSKNDIKNTYSSGEAAVLAIRAGADMVYCPENFPDTYRAVLDAVRAGEIEETQIEQAVGRILNRKHQMPTPNSQTPEQQPENTNDENEAGNENAE